MKKMNILILLLSLILATSCMEVEQKKIDYKGRLFQFDIEVLDVSEETSQLSLADIPYQEGDFTATIKIKAVDLYGNTVNIDDPNFRVTLYTSSGTVSPAILTGSDFTNGETGELTVSLLKTYEQSYIIAKQNNASTIGISDRSFFFKDLDIYDLQVPSTEALGASTHYNDSYVRVSQNKSPDGKIARNNLVIIHVSGSGMYITDLDRMDVDGTTTGDNTAACMIKEGDKWVKNDNFVGYSTMYVYSRNAPVDYTGDSSVGAENEEFEYLKAGQKLDWFAGNLVEFPPGFADGMSEMGFPIWEVLEGESEKTDAQLREVMSKIPICPIEHNQFINGPTDSVNIKYLERLESNLVEVKDVKVGEFDPDHKDYKVYSQWQIAPSTGGTGLLRVHSAGGAAEFDQLFDRGLIGKDTQIASIKGILHHVYGELWVIYVRNKCDIRLKTDVDGWNAELDKTPECNVE